MIYVVSMICVLGVLVFVHELGHFLAAKALGVKVLKFSLGFPPRLVGKKIGETEYLISWVPLGGYVRMYGEAEAEGRADEEGIPPGERHRSFAHKPAWARFVIVAAGPLFNFLFALLVFCLVFLTQGVAHLSPQAGQVLAGEPAAEAGLLPGDVITQVDGKDIKYFEDISTAVSAAGPREIEVRATREGRQLEFRLTPRAAIETDLLGDEVERLLIGIGAAPELIVERVSPLTALTLGAGRTVEITRVTFLALVRLIQGRMPLKTVGGPIFIAQLAGERAKSGFLEIVFFTALLSINLAIINLFPIPILDGGHLAFLLIEMGARRPVPQKVREAAQQVGMVLIILLIVVIFYNDLNRILGFSQLWGG